MSRHAVDIAVDDTETTTLGALIDKFYQAVVFYPPKKKKPIITRPLAIVRNPLGLSVHLSPCYFVVYPRHYFLQVEMGTNRMEGPHRIELCYQVRPGHHIRLAACQGMFPFDYELKVRKGLRRAIRKQKFFASEQTRLTEIELPCS